MVRLLFEELERREEHAAPKFSMNEPRKHEAITATKLLVRVLQDVVSRQRFDSYAELATALKDRCGQLKVPYDAALVSQAIDRLEMGGKKRLISSQLPRRFQPKSEAVSEPDLPRADAAALLLQLRRRCGGAGPKVMPRLVKTTVAKADHLKARKIVQSEILASIQRCEALEAESAIVAPADFPDLVPVPW